MKINFLPVIICLSGILFIMSSSFGQSSSWKGTTSVWATPTNWVPTGIPTSSTDVIIGNASFTGTAQPSIASAITVKSITFATNKASTLTIGTANALTVSGNITIGSNGAFSGTSPISLTGNWSNANSSTNIGSAVTFNGSAQSIGGTAATTFKTLNINSGTVTLTSNIILTSTALGTGLITVSSGTFDLSTFSANRSVGTPGGTLKVLDGAFLKIGGINSMPSNYATYTLGGTSTVEYNGANQAIAGPVTGYGNLVLSTSGGSVIKTATSNIITGAINIGASITFDGATFSHSVSRNWINNGTFIPGTSTVTFNGASEISGSNLVKNFYDVEVAGSLDLFGSATVGVHNLSVMGGSLLLDAATLQIGGTVSSSGTFDASVGILEMNGAATQNIPGNIFLSNAVDQLVISNSSSGGVVLDGAVDVYGSLTYSAAGLTLTTNDFLTLKSTAANTAWIGNTTGETITGKVTVERYIPERASWHLLSIPTNTTQKINETWQEGATDGNDDPVPGYGTQIVSNSPTWSADGFDLNSARPSMKTFNSSTGGWDGIANTNVNGIHSLSGYMVFIRGNRTANALSSLSSETVLRTQGSLYTGDQAPISVTANNFTCIGNPYASDLDMRRISKTGLKDFFYVWDPTLAGSFGLGGYQTFSNNGDGDYTVTPGSDLYGASGSISNYLFNGQAFLVQAGGTDGNITFEETDKKTSDVISSSLMATLPKPQFRTSLYGINTNNSAYLIDGMLINYDDSYSNNVDGSDAIKLINTSENLSIKAAKVLLVIERRHSITGGDSIFLDLTNTKKQRYRFQFTAVQLNQQGLTGFLEDSYLHTSTALNLNGSTAVDFNVVNIPGSYAPDRFSIVFKPALLLPLSFTSIKACRQNTNIAVEWKVENESNLKQYNVEKSVDGNHYEIASTVTANNLLLSSYNWLDVNPSEGNNYYRVLSTDVNGKTAYSTVAKVFVGKVKQSISIYPNPVTDGIINLQLTNQPAGIYGIRLLNNAGQVLLSKHIDHTQGSSIEIIHLNNSSARGIYRLEVTRPARDKVNRDVIY